MNIYQKLEVIQKTLNAPKSQYNGFGKYHYRSCEDILGAVKPLLDGCALVVTDEIQMTGDRFYLVATAKLTDGKESVEAKGYAREDLTKKGMDSAQITGSTSSYARKYALNGLFAIDDSKDPDATNDHGKSGGPNHQQRQQPAQNQAPKQQPTGDIANSLQSATDMASLVKIYNALNTEDKREYKPTFDAMRSSFQG